MGAMGAGMGAVRVARPLVVEGGMRGVGVESGLTVEEEAYAVHEGGLACADVYADPAALAV